LRAAVFLDQRFVGGKSTEVHRRHVAVPH
jgi:hypothetical protein